MSSAKGGYEQDVPLLISRRDHAANLARLGDLKFRARTHHRYRTRQQIEY